MRIRIKIFDKGISFPPGHIFSQFLESSQESGKIYHLRENLRQIVISFIEIDYKLEIKK